MDTYCTVGIHKVHRYSWYWYWLVSRSTSTQVGLMAHLSHFFFFFHVLEWHRVPVFPIVQITSLSWRSSFLQLLRMFRWTPTPPSWTAAAKAVFVLLQSSSSVNWRASSHCSGPLQRDPEQWELVHVILRRTHQGCSTEQRVGVHPQLGKSSSSVALLCLSKGSFQ